MKKKTPEKMRFSKKVIIFMLSSVAVFIVVMIITYWKFQSVPDMLIDKFFDFFKLEGGALGIIKIAEIIVDKLEIKKTTKSKK